MSDFCAKEITVYGRVQGVGFRPFVARTAGALHLTGTVQNAGGIVVIHAAGAKEALDELVHRLSMCPPEGARVDRVVVREDLMAESNLLDEHSSLGKADLMTENPLTAESGFHIIPSKVQNDRLRFLTPDISTCDRCVFELFDKKNRRYHYPFLSCTSCGPRFSIMEAVPYDRDTITMRDFTMCRECRTEYEAPGNVRQHAQTIACAECGPRVRLYLRNDVAEESGVFNSDMISPITKSAGKSDCNKTYNISKLSTEKPVIEFSTGTDMDALEASDQILIECVRLIGQGKIIAIKDIGGYHFAFDPHNNAAALRLRSFKNRENKPFAVMFPDIESLKSYCAVSKTEEQLLTSKARPIVLLKKKAGRDFAPAVCGESRRVGAILPCNPLQHLILAKTGPLVMTSGNRGGEPILTEDADMISLMQAGGPDAVLAHDRRILFGLDDSIYQVIVCDGGGQTTPPKESSNLELLDTEFSHAKSLDITSTMEKPPREIIQILRRARGLVPEPLVLDSKKHLKSLSKNGSELSNEISPPFKEDCFAAGGDLKSVFAFGQDNLIYLSGHFGDLDDYHAVQCRRDAISHMRSLLGIQPQKAVCDMHPDYISVRNLQEDISAGLDWDLQNNRFSCPVRDTAESLPIQTTSVQHHHAHIGAVMAEYGLTGPLLGISYDGTGYGTDGTIWGGEFLLCEAGHFQRAGHLSPVPLMRGDTSAKDAVKTAFCFLYEAARQGYMTWEEAISYPFFRIWDSADTARRNSTNSNLLFPHSVDSADSTHRSSASAHDSSRMLLCAALDKQINVIPCSSMGRLFDAAAAILGICGFNSYEGECPEKLQSCAEEFLEQILSRSDRAFSGGGNPGNHSAAADSSDNHSAAAGSSDNHSATAGSSGTSLPTGSPNERSKKSNRLSFPIHQKDGIWIADSTFLIAELAKKRLTGVPAAELAYLFHAAVSKMTVEMCCHIAGEKNETNCKVAEKKIALSGGTMYNGLLLRMLVPALEAEGFQVYLGEKIPAGDGGLAVGQLYLNQQ